MHGEFVTTNSRHAFTDVEDELSIAQDFYASDWCVMAVMSHDQPCSLMPHRQQQSAGKPLGVWTLKPLSSGALMKMLSFAGWASGAGTVLVGQGLLLITKRQGIGMPGLENLLTTVCRNAAAHYALKRQDFEMVDHAETKLPFILGE